MSAWLLVLGLALGRATTVAPAPAAAPTVMPVPVVFPAQTGPQPELPDRWLAEDKLQHFAMSFAATGMAYGGARFAFQPAPARGFAAGLALALGVGKELADRHRGGPFSLRDLAWDVAGVALGMTLANRTD